MTVSDEHVGYRRYSVMLGPNGYSFSINLNGYIIFHPNLKSRSYMKDPPDIDLLEIEINTPEKQKMRKKMIMENIDTITLDTPVLTQDMKYMYSDTVTYSFTPIKGTSFSLAISVPSYQKEYPRFKGKLILLDPSLLKSTSWTKFAAPWNYHKNQTKLENETITVEEIAALLKSDPDPDKWNLQKLFHLYWDLKTIKEAETFSEMIKGKLMSNDSSTNSSDTDGHILSFISTNGGLTQVFASRDNISFDYFVDPMEEPFYQRAHHSNKYIFLIEPFSKAYEEGNSTYPPNITVVRSIPVTDSNKRIRYKTAG
ncbi:voltage-dependent calcium channel subunit alpha-2/delta-2-like [Gigantopelta aegis]|uniref:voltage-dependent calcium channel subunit alpha-2/delta-2-like n=1 Tax=Gigantopelta aegis TaxID=1735272 RepID=UPI001B88C660|nr:voltage-dependent calcium channel subunit alpha-2/delta-2-like [Gigantopelta aegis]